MEERQKESAVKSALGQKLDEILGEKLAKTLREDMAMVFAKHNLVQKPNICEMALRYMVFVTRGWNSV